MRVEYVGHWAYIHFIGAKALPAKKVPPQQQEPKGLFLKRIAGEVAFTALKSIKVLFVCSKDIELAFDKTLNDSVRSSVTRRPLLVHSPRAVICRL